jgi:hypothetical protein
MTGWPAIRPVLAGFLLVADALVVAALPIAHPVGWLPPFIAFGSLLIGLVWFEAWAIRHATTSSSKPRRASPFRSTGTTDQHDAGNRRGGK